MHHYSAVIRVCLSQKFCIGGLWLQGHNDLGLYLFGDILVVKLLRLQIQGHVNGTPDLHQLLMNIPVRLQ
jgi:hypothetical protein